MLVLLSANIAFSVSQNCKRASLLETTRMNILGGLCKTVYASTRKRDVKFVKMILRHNELRGVLRHYFGRRSCGTRRVMRFARFK